MKKLHYILKYVLIFIGAVIFTNGLFLNITTNFNLGNLLQLIFGGSILTYGIFYKTLKEKCPKWIKLIYWFGISFFVIFTISIITYGSFDNVTYKEDAVIILGAGIRGQEPGALLKGRLDSALEYKKKNPDVIFVLSGGQGSDEQISEADAMARYLLERGVYPKDIIIEDKSTSTRENFQFSKELLDKFYEGKEYKTAYITNEFHIYRAGVYAKLSGFENTTHLHSNSRIGGIISTCLRETLAVVKLWVFGK